MRLSRARTGSKTKGSQARHPVRAPGRAARNELNEPFVLVIDDNDDGREVLTDALKAEGYRVESASNGAAALTLVRRAKGRPFLVLVDLLMPRMDGWEFCRRARAEPRLALVPIWVLSGAVVQRPFPASVEDVLLKPVDLDALVKVVDDAWDGM